MAAIASAWRACFSWCTSFAGVTPVTLQMEMVRKTAPPESSPAPS